MRRGRAPIAGWPEFDEAPARQVPAARRSDPARVAHPAPRRRRPRPRRVRSARAWSLAGRLGIPGPAVVKRAGVMAGAVVLVGLASMGSGPDAATRERAARGWEDAARRQIHGELRAGEKAVLLDRITRLDRVVTFSARFGIPADLSGDIYDAAEAEGVEPELAFALVRVESSFRPRAVSSMGAVGLTQVLPSTAFGVDPRLDRTDLFRRGTNLRVGFRYLRGLIDRYDGDLRTALLAYNRGPTRVDSLQSLGVDPGNGYARAVMELAVP
ncbi:MAG TPA: lytic transglycosylase domain-containing protein [Longimicrobiales bacterium]|nr:lytic transglycosylase domain-containing protein [Longimicrobiales bacterium]